MSVDPKQCPLCREGNGCAMLEGKSTCWCFDARLKAETLERIPVEARGLVCICKRCAEQPNAARLLTVVPSASP